ncbi:hypothetical protein [Alkaliphilus sp. B6464]|uniref:hypothetical protein n=1 Tax=Alkaliphilus sp. B6464 TaxID=2731219 RepID=UPI001BAA6523|nr:hypothetical protein [Alkaliphilus sp. B6464]QUH21438.1 hypothetical protein HYG84_17150 [Alkaliphilus sp. B6464]
MKQHITFEEFDSLTDEHLDKLFNLMGLPEKKIYVSEYDVNIGRMIGVLQHKYWITLEQDKNNSWHVVLYEKEKITLYHQFHVAKPELCDALWEAVKEVL